MSAMCAEVRTLRFLALANLVDASMNKTPPWRSSALVPGARNTRMQVGMEVE